jgi:A/G-specific adenine glycosylase
VSEVLLQRTQAPRVADFFGEFIESFPSWRRLSEATETELGKFLKPLGLWRRRGASLISLAREMSRRRGRFPKTRKDLESLPGVGQYIANAILLLCHNEPQPLLDVNMARVLERNFGTRKLADIRYDPYIQALAKQVVAEGDARSLNWAILDLAASMCIVGKPHCWECPLSRSCLTGRRSLQAS